MYAVDGRERDRGLGHMSASVALSLPSCACG